MPRIIQKGDVTKPIASDFYFAIDSDTYGVKKLLVSDVCLKENNNAGDVGGYLFDGVDDYVLVNNNDNIQFGTQNFSLEYWGIISQNPNNLSTYISKVTSGQGFILRQAQTSSPHIQFTLWDNNWNNSNNLSYFSSNLKDLMHIVAVREGGTLRLYINSVNVANNSGGIINVNNSSANLYISYISSDYRGKHYLTRLWNRALSQQDIISLYNNGRPDLYALPFSDRQANQTVLTSGTLQIGKRYRIDSYTSGDNFTNVGANSNATGVEFIATGTTPTTWTNGSQLRQIGCVAEYRPENAGRIGWLETQNRLHGQTFGSPVSLAVNNNEIIYRDIKTNITGNTTLTNIIPAQYRIKGILINNTTSNSVTINIGTTSNGNDVVNGLVCPAGLTFVNDAQILKKIFSLTSDQTLFVSSSNWNSASLNIEFGMTRY